MLTDETRRMIYRLKAGGLSNREIGRRVGQGASTVNYVVRPFGGVFRTEVRAARPTGRLSIDDRVLIFSGLKTGLTFTEISVQVGKSVSTISREVGGCSGRSSYQPVKAHERALCSARRPKATKLGDNPGLAERVITDLRALWSPAQIAARLRVEHSGDKAMCVSHETIYKSIYVQGRGELRRELAACLRSGREQRLSGSRMERPGPVRDAVSISDRPAEADDRAVPGHWEGDLIIGKDSGSAIGTLVERSTRFVVLLHLPGRRGPVEIRDAMIAAIQQLPDSLKRSVTWDRGQEMARHLEFTIATGVKVFFCDPHSPWQRGSNENTNGLLRQYFPKGTDLSVHSAEALQAAADSLNGRPRETLGWSTPAEALARFLATTA
jgi:transposase, IS30 family